MLAEISIAVVNIYMFVIMSLGILSLIGLFKNERITKSKQKPSVSVIIAVWNEGKRIERCIASILKNDYPKFEIIVVGGGEDETSSVCRRLAKERKIKYTEEEERMGKWRALNKGIEKSKGNVLLFTDGDCIVEKNWISKLATTEGEVVTGSVYTSNEKSFLSQGYSAFQLCFNYFVITLSRFKFLKFLRITSGQNLSVKREFIEKKALKFRQSSIEDVVFGDEARRKGARIIWNTNARVYHAVPEKVADVGKMWIRLSSATFSPIRLDWVIIEFLTASFFLFSNILFYINIFVFKDMLTVYIYLSLVVLAILILLLFTKRERNYKYLLFLPQAFAFTIIVAFYVLLGMARGVAKRKVEWKIVDKKF